MILGSEISSKYIYTFLYFWQLQNKVTGVSFVKLPKKDIPVQPGTFGIVPGWGIMGDFDKTRDLPEILRSLDLKVMPTTYCKNLTPNFNPNVQFCTEKMNDKYLNLVRSFTCFLY